MPTYLTKRDGTYYFRRVVPQELRSAVGKREFVWSLRTKNLAEAKKLCHRDAIKTDEELERASGLAQEQALGCEPPAGLTSNDFSDVAIRRDAARIAAAFRRRLHKAAECGEVEAARQSLANDLQLHESNLKTGWLADQISLAMSERYALGLVAVLDPKAAPLLPAMAERAPHSEVRDAVSFDALIEQWVTAQQPTDKSASMWRRTVRDFVEAQGNKPIQDITKRDILAFVVKLVEAGRSPATIDNRLNQLRSLFRFAMGRDYISSDPTAGVKPPANKSVEKARYPWTLEALHRLFASGVYQGDEVPEGGKGEAAYFLPLLGLFTGARINELAQLRPQDVVEETYRDDAGNEQVCWVMRFVRDKEDGLTLKNAASVRRIPIHHELERLGFIDLVNNAKLNGDKRIFHLLEPDRYGNMSAAWGKWFGRYIRSECGVLDAKITFHSFRHGFKDTCRSLDFPEDVHDAITGHTNSSVSRRYGGLNYPLNPMVKVIRGYKIYGLSLPSPRLIRL